MDARPIRRIVAAATVALTGASAVANEPTAVDTALILAVDVSGSMDMDELEVQRKGYLAALRHPELLRIVAAGPRGRIALAHFEWAGSVRRPSTVPWRIIDGQAAMDAFAADVEALPIGTSFGTSITVAIDHAMEMIDAADFAADAWVIDVSGDGPNNMGAPVTDARDRALDAGVTINGLPIVVRPSRGAPDLAAYYETCVIGGPAAFVLAAHSVEELAPAIRRKLFRELVGSRAPREAPEKLTFASVEPPVDCLAGERLRGSPTGAY